MRYPLVKLLDWRDHEAGLVASANPFAVVVQAHLAAREAVDAHSHATIGLISQAVRPPQASKGHIGATAPLFS